VTLSDRLTAGLQRVALAHLPTPLEAAPRLSAQVGGPPLWIKREDLSGLALGGNKARQLEFLLAAALADGAQAVVTTAAVQSNFCRACAAAGAKLGLKVGLLLRGNASGELQGNHLLDKLFGAELRYIDTQDAYDPRIPAWLDEFVADFERRGLMTAVLHLPGRSGVLGAAAMASLGEELAQQFAQLDLQPQAVFVAAGSGLTVAGLALAFKALDLPVRVVGISVQRAAAPMVPLIVERANAAAQLLCLAARIDGGDFEFDARWIGDGYGVASREAAEAMLLAGRSEGLVLDPAYTGKALAGALAQVREGAWRGTRPIVFVHSGGAPGLFANARQLAPWLS
jgi:1-aminocyclopropane-1-carboxylate deaminase/D-cysteine desulfhydrase-like pyridoxal-dependent ACC family enzyme